MNHLAEVRKSFSAVLLDLLLEPATSVALSNDAFSYSSPGKQMDWMASSGYLWLPAQSPGHSKAPPSTWPVTSDPGPVANTGVGEVKGGSVGIRLPGPRPQMKESVVSIPQADLWGPGSCRTGISPNPGSSPGCVDKLYLQLYMCMCVTREVAVWLPVSALTPTRSGTSVSPFASQELQFSHLWNRTVGSL